MGKCCGKSALDIMPEHSPSYVILNEVKNLGGGRAGTARNLLCISRGPFDSAQGTMIKEAQGYNREVRAQKKNQGCKRGDQDSRKNKWGTCGQVPPTEQIWFTAQKKLRDNNNRCSSTKVAVEAAFSAFTLIIDCLTKKIKKIIN